MTPGQQSPSSQSHCGVLQSSEVSHMPSPSQLYSQRIQPPDHLFQKCTSLENRSFYKFIVNFSALWYVKCKRLQYACTLIQNWLLVLLFVCFLFLKILSFEHRVSYPLIVGIIVFECECVRFEVF